MPAQSRNKKLIDVAAFRENTEDVCFCLCKVCSWFHSYSVMYSSIQFGVNPEFQMYLVGAYMKALKCLKTCLDSKRNGKSFITNVWMNIEIE